MKLRVTFTRECEYVADVDAQELYELLSSLPEQRAKHAALCTLDDLVYRRPVQEYDVRSLTYLINNTGTGRDWLGALADNNPSLLGGTGAPGITELRPKGDE